MATTPNGVPYPEGTEVPDAPFWLQQMAEYIDANYGDSGWITPTFGAGWTEVSGYQVRARRIGKVCRLRGMLARGSTASLGALLALPQGFAPAQQQFLGAHVMSSGASYNLLLSDSGGLQIVTAYSQGTLPASGGAWPITATWMTE